MEKKRLHILSLLLCLSALTGKAHAQSVQMSFTEKVILTDSLHMPDNTSAYNVLIMLPELLQRPGTSILSNYTVLIEGMPISQVSDVALNQLMIDDVERITVSESPISTYTNNGVGGTINLKLRTRASEERSFWGSAGVTSSYPSDVAPQFVIGKSGEKYSARGFLFGDFYSNHSDEETLVFSREGEFQSSSRNALENRYNAQVAAAMVDYRPSKKDNLSLNVLESSTYAKDLTTPDFIQANTKRTKSSSTSLSAIVNYSHSFQNSTFLVSGQYQYDMGHKTKLLPSFQNYRNDARNNTLSGKVQYTANLKLGSGKMELGVGSNLNSKHTSETISNELIVYKSESVTNPKNHTFFVQPYVYMTLTSGAFRMKLTGEFQHIRYDINRLNGDYSASSDDLTGSLIGEWHLRKNQNLRLMIDRKLQRPSAGQLFPTMDYQQEDLGYVMGNPYLTPVMSHEVRLDYLLSQAHEDGQFVFNASASYNHVSDLIHTKVVGDNPVVATTRATLRYKTYENDGTDDILNGNLMLLYQYKSFVVSLTGNVYHKHETLGGVKSKYTYFNLSFHPHFTLKDGWHGGVLMAYYNKVHLMNGTRSGVSVASMSVGKSWKGLYVYVYDQVALQKRAEDVTKTEKTRTVRSYEMIPNMVGMGIRYSF